jgi:hypothetical protein
LRSRTESFHTMKRWICIPAVALLSSLSSGQDVVVHCGETLTLAGIDHSPSTLLGTFTYDSLIVERGGVLRFTPTTSGVHLEVRGGMRVEGLVDLSGEDARPVRVSFSGYLQELGGLGGPGGGRGGTGNFSPGQSNPKGGDGLDPAGLVLTGFGGIGGDSCYGQLAPPLPAAGGGGGRLEADQPVDPLPLSPLNLGLVATDGIAGASTGHSALGPGSPRGGSAGQPVFSDSNPFNDFWGRQVDPMTGAILIGELVNPAGGRGGGAGGDSIQSVTFPMMPYLQARMRKGAGGGGGGGLAVIKTPRLEILGDGRIRSDGGDGARMSSVLSPYSEDNGGGSGGGSGGMILLQVTTLDLRSADERAITALGGRGGPGVPLPVFSPSGGGNGGPGIIQLHMVNGRSGIHLPTNRTLADMTAPTAYVLLPEPNL